MTPFAHFTDEITGKKHVFINWNIQPDLVAVDADHMMELPKGLTRNTGMTALAQALEAYVSLRASDQTDGFALRACQLVFRYLPRACNGLQEDAEAREKMANAGALAGMAAANTASGLIHAMACALSAWHCPIAWPAPWFSPLSWPSTGRICQKKWESFPSTSIPVPGNAMVRLRRIAALAARPGRSLF